MGPSLSDASAAEPAGAGRLLRLGAWYGAAVGSVAIGPWVALILVARGWSEAGASAALLVFPVGRTIASPLWGAVADRVGADRVLRLVAGLSAGCALALLGAEGPWTTLALLAGWSFVRNPSFPIVDAAALAALGPRYGAARAVGSAGFLAVGVVNGLTDGATALGLLAALSVATFAATFALPPAPPRPPPGPVDLGWLADPRLRALFAVSALHGASLAIYDHLFALHVAASGLPGWVQSMAIATGVGAEISVMVAAPWILRRVGHRTLFLVAVGTGVPRFLLTAAATAPLAVGGLQVLHGLHFGAFWIAATALFAQVGRPEWRNTVQALLPASGFGVGPILGLVASSALLATGADTAALFGIAAASSAAAFALALATLRADPAPAVAPAEPGAGG